MGVKLGKLKERADILGELKPSRRKPNEISAVSNTLINIFFWIYSALCVIPLLLVIIVSFSDEDTVLREGYSFFPKRWDTSSYEFLFKDYRQILDAAGVSLFVTVAGTVLSLLVMALYAYPISRKDFPHRNVFAFFMFFTMLFNGGLVPWYLVYTQALHLKDTLWILMMPLLVSAFYVMLLRTFFANTIPAALIESANIDGASEPRIFVRIILPLSLPVLATVGLFQTLAYWNDWYLSLIFISADGHVNLQYLMYKTMLNVQFLTASPQAMAALAAQGVEIRLPTETVRMAMAVVGIGPIVFVYSFFQKYFVQGLTVGAVKG
ncbi:carbohydrate ABC transporter permease ['Paenibacillus yunnanensis' Narsing Rao et al. 2020]|uniref:carbohydrate ABC transporter permease n=1 Tax=Paenibacillus tengchongensis TaxID=2608684 RepID=UPI00124CC969|nr:carbohydrate ABC transporter permease [Paenibacillus tengchongensis]